MEGAEAIDLTVGYHCVYLSVQLGYFTQAVIVAITLFEHKKRGKKTTEGKR